MANHDTPDIDNLVERMRKARVDPNPAGEGAMNRLTAELASAFSQDSGRGDCGRDEELRNTAAEPSLEDQLNTPGLSVDDQLYILAGGDLPLEARYEHFFTASGNILDNADLPTDPTELEELSRLMSDHIIKNFPHMHPENYTQLAPSSPMTHPYYPFWLPEHAANEKISLSRKLVHSKPQYTIAGPRR